MKPDKIYVDEDLINFHVLGERIHENDVEYVRKDYLLGWLNERYKSTISNVGCYTGHSVWAEVIEKLESL